MAAMLSKVLSAEKLLIATEGARFLITGKNSPNRKGHNDFNHLWGKYPGSFVSVNGWEEARFGLHLDVTIMCFVLKKRRHSTVR